MVISNTESTCIPTIHLNFLQDGATPLFMASQNGHTSVVDVLLRHGVDPNVPDIVSIIKEVYVLVTPSFMCRCTLLSLFCECLLNQSFSSMCARFYLGVKRIFPSPFESHLPSFQSLHINC